MYSGARVSAGNSLNDLIDGCVRYVRYIASFMSVSL